MSKDFDPLGRLGVRDRQAFERHPSRNFSFLLPYERQLDRLGAPVERYFADDPSTALIKLGQFGEELARQTAARNNLLTAPDEPQSDLLRRLKFERAVPP